MEKNTEKKKRVYTKKAPTRGGARPNAGRPKGSTNNSNQGVISGNVQAFFTSNGVNWYTIGI